MRASYRHHFIRYTCEPRGLCLMSLAGVAVSLYVFYLVNHDCHIGGCVAGSVEGLCPIATVHHPDRQTDGSVGLSGGDVVEHKSVSSYWCRPGVKYAEELYSKNVYWSLTLKYML